MTVSALPSGGTQQKRSKNREQLDAVVVRFAGDSGDGIQITGGQFTNESAIAGNDLSTLPNFPAEIRAPAGTLAGVSGFQIQFGSHEIHTPGDIPDVLVCMNPAALKSNLGDLKKGGILIINEDSFVEKNLQRVGYSSNPIEDPKIHEHYAVYSIPITKLTKEALKETTLSSREVERCKNFFTLGLALWLFDRPSESTTKFLEAKFQKQPEIKDGTIRALQAGLTYAEATELFDRAFSLRPAKLPAGTYRNITGTLATAYGLVAAAQKSGLPMFYGAYPITPASDLLHELAKQKRFGVTTFQAEDEIAAIGSAIGAAYAGALGITCSSGPGISLKQEALGWAVIAELPLVILNIQRGGPSTGLPTKTEQADLLQAIFGRHGEAPVCVLAASSPTSAFELSYEACRIATKYMTPVIFLSDGFIANCSEPWRIPDPSKLRPFTVPQIQEPNGDNGQFLPYLRDKESLGRPWAVPGTPHLMHRLGGIEKQDKTGNISYDPENHHLMCTLRAEKIERIAAEIPPTVIDGPAHGELLIVGWGGTAGTLCQATAELRAQGLSVSRIHIHHLSPLPPDLESIFSGFSKVLIPEINFGQLRMLVRSRFLIDAHGLNLVRGQPLQVKQVIEASQTLLSKGHAVNGIH